MDGPVSKTGSSDFIFPTGDGSVWARIGIYGLTSNTTFTAEYFDAAYSNTSNDGTLGSVSTKEYWMLDRIAGSSGANVQLFWESGTHSEIDQDKFDNLAVAHYNGTNWESKGQSGISGSTAAGDVTSGAVDSFSPFTFGMEPSILPVRFLSFQPVVRQHAVELHWQTANEEAQDYFTVERSADGLNFQPVARVQGKGQSGVVASYQVADIAPLQYNSYYRIKETNADGLANYSAIKAVSRQVLSGALQLYPNPSVDGRLWLQAAQELNADDTQVKVFDMLGMEQVGYQLSGQQQVNLDLSALPQGTYFVEVHTPAQTKTFRVFIK